jgi:hypothetical protein
MAALVDETPFPHLTNFVNAVAELIAAIFDVHGGRAHRQVATIYVGYAGHQRSGIGDKASVIRNG